MAEKYKHNDELIVKVLIGTATKEEQTEYNELLNADMAFKRDADAMKTVWAETGKLKGRVLVDENEAWNRFKANKEPEQIEIERGTHGRVILMQIAAAVALAVVLVYSFFGILGESSTEVVASKHVEETIMNDNSVIALKKDSKLVYSETYNKNNRKVRLEGQGFFDVQPNKELPFVVETENLTVTVLGTSFAVKDDLNDSLLQVSVKTGTVKVEFQEQTYILKAGKQIELNKAQPQNEAMVTNLNVNNIAWQTKKLVFEKNDLAYVVEKLNDTYEASFELKSDNTADCFVTATFDNVALQSVLSVLESTIDISITQIGNKVVIETDGCSE